MKKKIVQWIEFAAVGTIATAIIAAAVSVACVALLLACDVITAKDAAFVAMRHLAILAAVLSVAFIALFCTHISKI